MFAMSTIMNPTRAGQGRAVELKPEITVNKIVFS